MRGFAIRILAFALILFTFWPAPAYAQGDDLPWMLGQFNALRARNGVGALVINNYLTVSANQHCAYLANEWDGDPGHFHQEPNGSTPQSRASAAGYPGRVGENVVGGQLATKEWAFDWWVHSPVHLKNMLEQWTEVGLAVCTGKNGRWYVADFGVESGGPTLAPPSISVTSMIPRPTHSATRVPTDTPTITYTPSVTFTPVASFTPTFTPTSLPPTQTPIVLEISPQATEQLVSMAISPVPPDGNPPAQTPADNGNVLRGLIPWAILLQITVVGGLATNAIVHRRRR